MSADQGPFPLADIADAVLDADDDERVHALLGELRFIAVHHGARFAVHALSDCIAIGSLRWCVDEGDAEGRVGQVFVSPGFRRRGVATALWRMANAYSDYHRISPPVHSDDQTDDGEAWARSLTTEAQQ